MRKKILCSNTIIPESLYVERSADRQLRQIIDNMGRPGYVLVARQMGKTNLLINMKRKRVNDLVLYLDLSNRLDSARAWFRNVIDSLIESNIDLFNDINKIIHEQRQTLELEPNVEYDRHLRIILNSTNKKVIIVLDEIDSLVNTNYSDIILAQIRSMYFSRINFSVYERLTYILSGVAEPSDLIKDKNISPFNIGEKIYLDDFSQSEFSAFFTLASISENEAIAAQVFEWTNGNPRMTWDICSEIEDRLIDGEEITTKTVDDVVHKLYLRDFDRAPVDHIRTLVESDSQIRDALISIRFGHSDFVGAKIKSKLYLSGITKNDGDGLLIIKNKVIDTVLSDNWLVQISYTSKNLIADAVTSYTSGKYEHAIGLYEQLIQDAQYKASLTVENYFELAVCYQSIKRFSKAMELLESCILETKELEFTQKLNYQIGLCKFDQNNYQSAINDFTLSIEGPNFLTGSEALLASLTCHINSNFPESHDQALLLTHKLIHRIESGDRLEDDDKNRLLVHAYYNQAIINDKIKNKNIAIECLNKAFDISTTNLQPGILIFQHDLSEIYSEKKYFIEQSAQVIINNDLRVRNGSILDIGLRKRWIALILSYLAEYKSEYTFDNLIKYIAGNYYDENKPIIYVVIDFFYSLNDENEQMSHYYLMAQAVKYYSIDNTSKSDAIKLFRFLTLAPDSPEKVEWCVKFIDVFLSTWNVDNLIEDDCYALVYSMVVFNHHRLDDKVDYLLSVWKKISSIAIKEYPLISSFMISYIMVYCAEKKNKEEALFNAREFLRLLDEENVIEKSSDIYNSHFNKMRVYASKILHKINAAHSAFKDIGRNQKVLVKYGDAEPVFKKFKQVQADLFEERCSLVKVL